MTYGTEPGRDLGAGPFVTLRHLLLPEGHRLWLARNHRKGLGTALAPRPFWQTPFFNALMGAGFAVGSLLFVFGAVLSLKPALVTALSLAGSEVNTVYFAGSVFFTTAACLQLFQSANAGVVAVSRKAPELRAIVGWRPHDPGWLSCATQFAGTLLFNVSTYYTIQGGNWLRQDLTIWGPDFLGSALFLLSGYLAVIETCHDWWAWKPLDLAWWIVTVNFVGCAAFMASAVLAFIPSSGPANTMVTLSTMFTLIGAVCFCTGALLSIWESTKAE